MAEDHVCVCLLQFEEILHIPVPLFAGEIREKIHAKAVVVVKVAAAVREEHNAQAK